MSADGRDPSLWFGGTEGRNDEEAAFLSHVRAAAAASEWSVRPEQTSSMPVGVPLYLSVDVPALERLASARVAKNLEVQLWPEQSFRGLRLEGTWGDSQYPFDSVWTVDDGALLVGGIQASPAELARWTITWLQRQLARPLRIRGWADGAGSVELADSGESLGAAGYFWRRRGAPLTDTVVRADQGEPPTR